MAPTLTRIPVAAFGGLIKAVTGGLRDEVSGSAYMTAFDGATRRVT